MKIRVCVWNVSGTTGDLNQDNGNFRTSGMEYPMMLIIFLISLEWLKDFMRVWTWVHIKLNNVYIYVYEHTWVFVGLCEYKCVASIVWCGCEQGNKTVQVFVYMCINECNRVGINTSLKVFSFYLYVWVIIYVFHIYLK